eukprot:GHUV01025875.1.p2 GENE.GHUV01025875.1~~GHUV01025875.1.p2  ORF type:complete len:139 (+),score=22.38 GHUV01025875.1:559-975(+)
MQTPAPKFGHLDHSCSKGLVKAPGWAMKAPGLRMGHAVTRCSISKCDRVLIKPVFITAAGDWHSWANAAQVAAGGAMKARTDHVEDSTRCINAAKCCSSCPPRFGVSTARQQLHECNNQTRKKNAAAQTAGCPQCMLH